MLQNTGRGVAGGRDSSRLALPPSPGAPASPRLCLSGTFTGTSGILDCAPENTFPAVTVALKATPPNPFFSYESYPLKL